MSYEDIVLGQASNSKIIEVMLRDATTGQAKASVAYGSVAYSFIREGTNSTVATGTCVDMTLDTYADHGWKETSIAGVYQFGVPQAALATGKNAVTIKLVVSGAIDVCKRILIMGQDLRAAAIAANMTQVLGTALPAESVGGRDAAALGKLLDVGTPVLTCACVNQTIDNPTAAACGTDAAGKVLVTPAQKLVTDGSGYVTYANAAPPAASAIADAVWDETSTGHTTAGKAGEQLWTDVDAILADTDELEVDWKNGGRLDLLLDGATAPSADTVAAAVWNDTLAGHAGVGSTGAALAAAGGSGDPWSTALPGAYGTGTAGIIIGGLLGLSSGTGSVEVDHDYGTTDALRFTTSGGLGIDGATVRAYLKSDWDADLRGDAYVKGRAETDVNGRWVAPMYLDAATYTLAYSVPGNNTTTTKEVTVT